MKKQDNVHKKEISMSARLRTGDESKIGNAICRNDNGIILMSILNVITAMKPNCEFQSNATGFHLINRIAMRCFYCGREQSNRPHVSF